MICAIAGMKKITSEERKMRMQFSSKREQSAGNAKTKNVSKQVEKVEKCNIFHKTDNKFSLHAYTRFAQEVC